METKGVDGRQRDVSAISTKFQWLRANTKKLFCSMFHGACDRHRMKAISGKSLHRSFFYFPVSLDCLVSRWKRLRCFLEDKSIHGLRSIAEEIYFLECDVIRLDIYFSQMVELSFIYYLFTNLLLLVN